MLDEAQGDLLLHLTPSAFDDDRSVWAIARAGIRVEARRVERPEYAEIAHAAIEEQLAAVPQDAQRRAALGFLAYMGRKAKQSARRSERWGSFPSPGMRRSAPTSNTNSCASTSSAAEVRRRSPVGAPAEDLHYTSHAAGSKSTPTWPPDKSTDSRS